MLHREPETETERDRAKERDLQPVDPERARERAAGIGNYNFCYLLEISNFGTFWPLTVTEFH